MIAVCIDKKKNTWDIYIKSAITHIQILKHSIRIVLNTGTVHTYTDWEGCHGEKITEENLVHFKACLLENAIGGNTNVHTDARNRSPTARFSGEAVDAD